MKQPAKITTIPDILRLMQANVWYNEQYKLFFSTRHTNNPQEYYFFCMDIDTNTRTHGKYKVTNEAVIVEMLHIKWKVKDLPNMRTYGVTIIQLIDMENELNYWNWCGADIPMEKGAPYILD